MKILSGKGRKGGEFRRDYRFFFLVRGWKGGPWRLERL
jgi:hypothetical protein